MRTFNYWLSLAMILVMPWMDMVHLPGMGTVSRVAGFAAAAFWGLVVLLTGKLRTPRSFHLLAMLFLIWTSTTALWSYDVDRTWNRMFIYVRMVGLILLLWDLYDRRSMIHMALQFYVLGAYIHAGSVIQNYMLGSEDVYGRFAATGNIANTTAYVLGMAIPLAWFLAVGGKQFDGGTAVPQGSIPDGVPRGVPGGTGYIGQNSQRWPRQRRWVNRFLPMQVRVVSWMKPLVTILNFAYVPVALMTIALTATRFGMLMAIPACLFGLSILLRSRGKAAYLILIILVIALIGLASFIPTASLERLAETGESIQAGDLTGRVTLWTIALATWVEHPLLGIGSDAFPSVNRSGKAVHNTYLVTLVETGVIGLAIYLLILYSVLAAAWGLPRWESLFWLAVIAVWGVASVVLNLAQDKSIWFFFGLILVNARIAQTEKLSQVVQEPVIVGAPRAGSWAARRPAPMV